MKRVGTILAIALGTALILMLIAAPADAQNLVKVDKVDMVNAPGSPVSVDVWTDKAEGSVYRTGEDIAVYFYANTDCYVTIYDIDTDGRVNILFPEYPDDGFVYGGMTYRLPDYYRNSSLFVSGPQGVEYIHAVASSTPDAFRYRPYRGRYHIGIDPVAGDPFEAMNSINGRIIAHRDIATTATTWFFVEARVWYPRYMCASCHGHSYAFDPYIAACPRYTVHVASGRDYWWEYSYYPVVSAHFSFGGPFWRFELRTIPVHRYRHMKYVDVAYGYHNYYWKNPPRRPYRHTSHDITRTHTRHDRERRYEPVTYRDVREGQILRNDGHSRTSTRSRTNTTTRTTPERSASSRSGTASTSRDDTYTNRNRTGGTTGAMERNATPGGTSPGRSESYTNRNRTSTNSSGTGDAPSTSSRTRTNLNGGDNGRVVTPSTSNRTTAQPNSSGDRTRTSGTERSSRDERITTPPVQTQSIPERTPVRRETATPSRNSVPGRNARITTPQAQTQSVPERTPARTETAPPSRSPSTDRGVRNGRVAVPQAQSQRMPERTSARTETAPPARRAEPENIQTSRIPAAPRSEASPSRSASSSPSSGSDSRPTQQSSSSSSSRSRTRER